MIDTNPALRPTDADHARAISTTALGSAVTSARSVPASTASTYRTPIQRRVGPWSGDDKSDGYVIKAQGYHDGEGVQ